MAAPESSKALVAEYLKKLLEERSSGRIQVKLSDDKILTAEQAVAELKQQKIQIAIPEIKHLNQMAPHLRMYELPFLFRDRRHLHEVIDSHLGDEMIATFPRQDLILLGIWEKGTRQLVADRDLSTPDQAALKPYGGERNETATTFFNALSGYSPLHRSGERSGRWQEMTLSDLAGHSFPLNFSDLTLTNHSVSGCALLIDRVCWEELSEDLKVIVSEAVKDATMYARELAEQSDQQALENLRADDRVAIHQPSQGQWNLWQKTMLQLYSQQCDAVEMDFIEQVAKIR